MREADVQPPKTAATQSELISLPAFSAKIVGSEAPSSLTTLSCLPSTPPLELICSAARTSESCTVFSLIAMVPESEFRNPIFTELPEVSAQVPDDEPPAPAAPTRLPQPADTSPTTIRTAAAVNSRFLVRSLLIATPLCAGSAVPRYRPDP